jgi:siderophore synthetase component
MRLAEQVSLETFVNCYVHELGVGRFHALESWVASRDAAFRGGGAFVLEIALPVQDVTLAFDVSYRSTVGCHGLESARLSRSGGDFHDVEALHVLLMLTRELYAAKRSGTELRSRERELEATLRVLESVQVMARYLEAHSRAAYPDAERFIEYEQSLLFGHWRHPMPKSRKGMSEWQHESAAPELRGRFRLHFFAVSRALIREQSARTASCAETIAAFLTNDPKARSELWAAHGRGEVLVPVHPLQVDWLRHQPHVENWLRRGLVRDVGRLGPPFTATSSVRTVYSDVCNVMLKFSIPVKITNSLRVNRRDELVAGVLMASLIERLGVETPRFLEDSAYLTVEAPGARESGFELIIRENPFPAGADGGVTCVAALSQRALPHRVSRLRSLIEGLSLTDGRNQETVSLEWLVRYLTCCIEPLIRLYDTHGIALEAHQQNCLLDVSGGYPSKSYYRDNQGYYLSLAHRDRLTSLEPALAERHELFFDDAVIRRQLAYYLIQNQLFSLVHRLGRESLLDEGIALSVIKARLVQLSTKLHGCGKALLHELLHDDQLASKANLLTRARDIDELDTAHGGAVYVGADNPFRVSQAFYAQELEVA